MRERRVDRVVSRRTFLGYITAAMGAFVATVAGVPVLGAFVSPALQKRSSGQWVSAGNVANFVMHQPKMVGFTIVKKDGWVEARQPRVVWVVRRGEKDFLVYNAQCTHLGCIVDWKDSGLGGKLGWNFYSPCHGGVFAMDDGRVLTGPPPRPLDTLEYKIENGELLCNYQDFRLGVPEKVLL